MITVFTVVYNNYGHFIPQWNSYMDNQTIKANKVVVLGNNHGADIKYLKDHNIEYVYYNSDNMGVLRNKAMPLIKTLWWLYFSIDDELLPNACHEIVNTNADAVSIRFNVENTDGTLLLNQNSPLFLTPSDVARWRKIKWGGYTAVRRNYDIRYDEHIEVPNLTFHFELYKRKVKIVESDNILIIHHRWDKSHHFVSKENGKRDKCLPYIDKLMKSILNDK